MKNGFEKAPLWKGFRPMLEEEESCHPVFVLVWDEEELDDGGETRAVFMNRVGQFVPAKINPGEGVAWVFSGSQTTNLSECKTIQLVGEPTVLSNSGENGWEILS